MALLGDLAYFGEEYSTLENSENGKWLDKRAKERGGWFIHSFIDKPLHGKEHNKQIEYKEYSRACFS